MRMSPRVHHHSHVRAAGNGLFGVIVLVGGLSLLTLAATVGVLAFLAALPIAGAVGIVKAGRAYDRRKRTQDRARYHRELAAWRKEQERRSMPTAPRQHPTSFPRPAAQYGHQRLASPAAYSNRR